jgi:transcription-repair coupling factor (superfamily II helicase)
MFQNQEKNSIGPYLKVIHERNQELECIGLSGSQRAYLVFRLYLEHPQPMVVVVPKASDAEQFISDLEFFCGEQSFPVIYFPSYHILPFKYLSYHGQTAAKRIRSLYKLLEYSFAAPPLVVTTSCAMIQKVMPREYFSDYLELVMENEDLETDRLVEKLNAGGYERTMIVEEPGDYSVRGGIVDVFSPLYDDPIRIELFGDYVDSLRFFSAENQRTLKRISEAVILPARETILKKAELPDIISRIRAQASRMETAVTKARELVDRIKEEGIFPGIEILLPLIYPSLDTFMDYVPKRALYILLEPRDLRKAADDIFEQAKDNYAVSIEEKSYGVEPSSLFLTWDDVENRLKKERSLAIKSFSMSRPANIEDQPIKIEFKVENNSELTRELKDHRDPEKLLFPFVEWINSKTASGMNTIIVSSSKSRAQKTDALLKPYGVHTDILEQFSMKRLSGQENRSTVFLCLGDLSKGFVWPEESLAIITDVEIFGNKGRHRKSSPPKIKTQLLSFNELKQGDLIVHSEHGIGQYHGLTKLTLNVTINDFLLLKFKDDDKLYLPVDRISMVQKYLGVDGITPSLDKLGGKSWERVKDRVKKSAEKIASELLKLYASRRVLKGHSFSNLSEEMGEFEAGFPYDETPDQLSAIEDVFNDMTSPVPMDRLICGDVGYGKTEVALRASFLAVHDGKQVAILTPTTVLAEQHYATFSERFRQIPVKIACLSRFRPAKDQRAIVEDLKSGKIDIVIGTHRLVQKDVAFKDLGLLILDEEQRFGVKHKEKLKQFKNTVDVLTLTATPIPRTLHMSLLGVRDISVLSTPPEYRRAIITYISEFDDTIIKDSIRKEMKRGGQIFFVHNNIYTIQAMARHLQELVPEVRMAVAHGRLEESKLEKIMLSFMNQELDMLVCTTIIESGLDIASANTILVNHADRFGLAQIYQLRGRVGRSVEQAYAYLFVPRESKLTKDAVKRLKVLMEHSDLGSGFQIAMSDLRIRGGGSILGASQSGHIAAVGYDTFLQLMEEAMAELKGEPVQDALEPEINFTLSTFIPESYIPDIDQRLSTYRHLARMNSLKELSDFKTEMEDRFGTLPVETSNLLIKIMLKVLAIGAGVKRLDLNEEQLLLHFSESHQKNPFGIVDMVTNEKNQYAITPDHIFIANLSKTSEVSMLAQTKNILKEIRQRVNG